MPWLKRRQFLMGGAGLAGFASLGASIGGCSPNSQTFDVMNDPQVADLHRRTFNFFWELGDRPNGLMPDRWPRLTFCSITAVGFALTAYCIGVKRGYITRAQAVKRTLTTLRFFWNAKQGDASNGFSGYKGFFYHFLEFDNGTRYKGCELSSVDTALFLMGALTAQAYFDADAPDEIEIRDLAQKLYERVDWQFMMRPSGLLGMGWHPETGFIASDWSGYSEGIICYLLGFASKTFTIDPSVWVTWCSTYDKTFGSNFGEPHVGYFSLYVHQVPHVWYDFRGIADPYMRSKGLTYFENTRRATLAQKNYAKRNPLKFKGYSGDIWGFSACDGPADITVRVGGVMRQFRTYSERGQSDKVMFDDGTIAPTAAISSIFFTPRESLAALKTMRRKYGSDIYGQYGFLDSFNPSYHGDLASSEGHQTPKAGWVSHDYLGLDQGTILCMIENQASGFIIELLRNSKTIQSGLQLAGFRAVEKTT